MAQGNFGVRGPGFSSISEQRIKMRAKKLWFFIGLGGNFGLKMFCFDLRECPVEERMLKWDNFDGLRVWDESESLSMVAKVLKMQKLAKRISKKAFEKVKFSVFCF